ncbi:ElyC/SanA/YdcF family protein [Kribbella aluminosa]|uniref:YdcF family protein n=1 Tax=Kribbella aluminosa TaxID=416017 RepID=UPI003CD09253
MATGRPEAHVFRDLLIRYGVPAGRIKVEDQSTNRGENADFTRRLIVTPRTLLLIQDPTMQRRTHACFERSFADLPGTTILSHAPLIPWIGPRRSPCRLQPSARLTSSSFRSHPGSCGGLTSGTWNRSPRSFVVSRAVRLYPAYWVAATLVGRLQPGAVPVSLPRHLANLTMFNSLPNVQNVEPGAHAPSASSSSSASATR